MANTVGIANFKITLAGDPVVTSALLLTLGGRAIRIEIRVRRRSSTGTSSRSQLLERARRMALPCAKRLLLQGHVLGNAQLAEHGMGFGGVRVVVEDTSRELQGPRSVAGLALQAREFELGFCARVDLDQVTHRAHRLTPGAILLGGARQLVEQVGVVR